MNVKAMALLALSCSLLVCGGCEGIEESIAIRRTLKFAGDNRAELESVLGHYSSNSAKEKAARYLIANMGGAYHLAGEGIDSLRAVVAETSDKGAVDPERRDRWMSYRYEHDVEKVYDARTISAEYLIENIDLAFKSMERWPWGRDYAFEDFCKYVLPYRIVDEAPDRWRSVCCDRFSSVLDSNRHIRTFPQWPRSRA